jgi:CheY-like chemotaxis protein
MAQSILVADDDDRVRYTIRARLEQAGYDVHEAANGSAAIQALYALPFDLVITDILMPDRDGLETIMHVRKRTPHTKVIAISGAADALFLADAAGLGAHGVLSKPFKPNDLLLMVQNLLRPVPPSPAPC